MRTDSENFSSTLGWALYPVQQTRGNVILEGAANRDPRGGHVENAMVGIEVTAEGAPSPITSSSNSDCVDSK